MNDKILQLVLSAKDMASATIARVGEEVGVLADGAQAASVKAASLGDSLDKTGRNLASAGQALAPFSIAAGVGLGLAAKAAMTFEQSMEMVHTQAGASQAEVGALTQKVLEMAPAVGQGPDALAKGLFFIESAGFRGAAAMDILKLSAEGAAVGQTDLAQTANALTSVMNTNIVGAQSATEAMGNLNAIVGAGKMHFEDLNGAISTGFLNTASTFGISLQSVGAALADLTRNGEPAQAAATRLRMAITLMAAPTNQASKILSGLGIDAVSAKAGTEAMTEALAKAHVTTSQLATDLKAPNGFSVAIQDLKTHLENSGLSAEAASAAIARAFGGGRSSGPILAMLNDTNGLNDAFQQITTNAGNFQSDWAAQQDTAKQKMDDFKASIQVLGVQLGNTFLPTLESLAKTLGGMVQWLNDMSPGWRQFTVDALLATAALTPLLLGAGKLFTALGAISNGLGAVTGLLGGVGGLAEGAGVAEVGATGLAAVMGGPVTVALGLMAGTALAGVAAYKLLHKGQEDNAHDAQVAAGSINVQTLFQDAQKKATDQQVTATNEYKAAQDAVKPTLDEVATKNAAVKDAQLKVNDALKQYGDKSPQYQSAVQTLKDRENELNDSLYKQLDASLQVAAAHNKLNDADKKLTDVTAGLTGWQDALKWGLEYVNQKITSMGPNALNQVNSIAVLSGNIDQLINKAKGINDIQGQADFANARLQGLGSTIDQLQMQGNNLVNTLQSASVKLQGGTGTAPVQGVYQAGHNAQGTSNWRGGLTWVGEQGPELVNLPSGAQVHSNADSQKMAGAGGNVSLTVNVGSFLGAPSDVDGLATKIYQALMRIDRSTGSNNLPSIGVRPA